MSNFPSGSHEDQSSYYVILIVSVIKLNFCFDGFDVSEANAQGMKKHLLAVARGDGRPDVCWQKIISSFHTNKIKS